MADATVMESNPSAIQDDSQEMSGIDPVAAAVMIKAVMSDTRPNKITDYIQKIMEAGKDAQVEIMVDPKQDIVVPGIVRETNNDREGDKTGFDVSYRQWSPVKREYFLVRTQLSKMRTDQIRLFYEDFAKTPMGIGTVPGVQVTSVDESLSAEEMAFLSRRLAPTPAGEKLPDKAESEQQAVEQKRTKHQTCPDCGAFKHAAAKVCKECKALKDPKIQAKLAQEKVKVDIDAQAQVQSEAQAKEQEVQGE